MLLAWTLYLLLLLALVAGIFLVVLTLPGLWLMLLAAIGYAAATHLKYLGWKSLIALLILAGAAEVIELVVGGAGAKKAGGGRLGVIGGLVGGLLGGVFLTFIPIPIISTIVGICAGAFIGASLLEFLGGKEIPTSVRIGVGAAKGKLMGIVSKLVFGVAMSLLILIAAIP